MNGVTVSVGAVFATGIVVGIVISAILLVGYALFASNKSSK